MYFISRTPTFTSINIFYTTLPNWTDKHQRSLTVINGHRRTSTTTALDPFIFDADPYAGSALKKMDPDPGREHFFKIYTAELSNFLSYFFRLFLC